MRKGVTPIVAIIILLLITIALAGAAYTYLSTYFTGVTGKATQIIDAYCTSANNATVILRNIGTQSITLCGNVNGAANATIATGSAFGCNDITITKSTGGVAGLWGTLGPTSLGVGQTAVFTDIQCDPGNFCSYRFLSSGSALGPALASVQC